MSNEFDLSGSVTYDKKSKKMFYLKKSVLEKLRFLSKGSKTPLSESQVVMIAIEQLYDNTIKGVQESFLQEVNEIIAEETNWITKLCKKHIPEHYVNDGEEYSRISQVEKCPEELGCDGGDACGNEKKGEK
jgi:hypothetical protein